jgi:uncharacterized membrane-anchored protein
MIKGRAVIDRKTKNIVKRLKRGQIAVICHPDIDEMAARDLVEKEVKAVVNTASSISGGFRSVGADLLLRHRVPLFDCEADHVFPSIREGDKIGINQGKLFHNGEMLAELKQVTKQEIQGKWRLADHNLEFRFQQFIENTLEHAEKEMHFFISPLARVYSRVKLNDRHVLIVARGRHYREDLKAIRTYMRDYNPILIGVDGGADALLEEGFTPDLIIGDMDSVSDYALQCGAEIIVHAYPNGFAPGKARVEELSVAYELLPACGTSEDVAMLYAFEGGAEWIVTIGTHSDMVDFLEKGRKGMGSTILVRMKIGNKLIDAKGVSMLYRQRSLGQRLYGILRLWLDFFKRRSDYVDQCDHSSL